LISFVKRICSNTLYPSLEILKKLLKKYLIEKHKNFINNLSKNEFANHFHREWLSLVNNCNLLILTFTINSLFSTIAIGQDKELSQYFTGQCSSSHLVGV